MVFVDTPVWIDFFNDSEPIHSLQIKELLRNRLVATNKIIIAEILGGAGNRKEYNRLRHYLYLLLMLPIDDIDHDRIAELNYNSIRKGFKIPITDWIIAINAFRNDALIYSHDRHFTVIRRFLDIKLFES